MISRRALLTSPAVLAASAARGQPGWTPTRAIRLVVPYGPGGGADTTSRLLAGPMGAALGQPVVVENRPGAGASIGAQEVARAAPDGHTMLMDAMAHFVTPVLMRLPIDYTTAFSPLSLVIVLPHVLLVPNDSPAHDLASLIAHVRTRPGQLGFGTSGNGTGGHLAAVMLARRAGLDVLNTPYRGIGPALQDLVAGRLGLVFATVASAMPLVRGGNARAVAVSSLERVSVLPGVPTIAEQGFPAFEMNEWNGLLLPAGVGSDVLTTLWAAVEHAVQDSAVRERVTAMGALLVGSSPAVFAEYLSSHRPTVARLIREERITLD
jgi:tripartite-type tricarboxylate transporter receptor subunit TctC